MAYSHLKEGNAKIAKQYKKPQKMFCRVVAISVIAALCNVFGVFAVLLVFFALRQPSLELNRSLS
jgi:hypothetical protein